MSFLLIYVTHRDEVSAKELGTKLLEERLIACANYFPISSAYWWQGGLNSDQEWVSLLKTPRWNWERVRERVKECHPYDLPCIIKLEVEANEEYEQWIEDSVGEPDNKPV